MDYDIPIPPAEPYLVDARPTPRRRNSRHHTEYDLPIQQFENMRLADESPRAGKKKKKKEEQFIKPMEKPATVVEYECWRFTKLDGWEKASRLQLEAPQKDLMKTVNSERKSRGYTSVHYKMTRMNAARAQQINRLLEDKRSEDNNPYYKWSCEYINAKQITRKGANGRPVKEVPEMDIIITRSVQDVKSTKDKSGKAIIGEFIDITKKPDKKKPKDKNKRKDTGWPDDGRDDDHVVQVLNADQPAFHDEQPMMVPDAPQLPRFANDPMNQGQYVQQPLEQHPFPHQAFEQQPVNPQPLDHQGLHNLAFDTTFENQHLNGQQFNAQPLHEFGQPIFPPPEAANIQTEPQEFRREPRREHRRQTQVFQNDNTVPEAPRAPSKHRRRSSSHRRPQAMPLVDDNNMHHIGNLRPRGNSTTSGSSIFSHQDVASSQTSEGIDFEKVHPISRRDSLSRENPKLYREHRRRPSYPRYRDEIRGSGDIRGGPVDYVEVIPERSYPSARRPIMDRRRSIAYEPAAITYHDDALVSPSSERGWSPGGLSDWDVEELERELDYRKRRDLRDQREYESNERRKHDLIDLIDQLARKPATYYREPRYRPRRGRWEREF